MALFELPVGEWTEVLGAAPANFSLIQNVGLGTIVVAYAPTPPSVDDRSGWLFGQNEGDRRDANLTPIYARPLNDHAPGRIQVDAG